MQPKQPTAMTNKQPYMVVNGHQLSESLTLRSTADAAALLQTNANDEDFISRRSTSRLCPDKYSKYLADDPLASIPVHYRGTCESLDISYKQLLGAFTGQGISVPRCLSCFTRGRDVIETIEVSLTIASDEPVFKMTNVKSDKSRFLLPDLYSSPTTCPEAVDYFANYQWPRGERQLLDMKGCCFVLVCFRNMREPLLFVTENPKDQQQLLDVFLIVRAAALETHQCKLRNLPQTLPSPIDEDTPPVPISGSSGGNAFSLALDEAAKKLTTQKAVGTYWLQAQDGWVLYWNAAKNCYMRRYLQISISLHGPNLIVRDRKDKPIPTHLDLIGHSLNRKAIPPTKQRRWSSFMRSQVLSPYVTALDYLEHGEKMYLSFETMERLKDFQQVVATLGYLQSRNENSDEPYFANATPSPTDNTRNAPVTFGMSFGRHASLTTSTSLITSNSPIR